MDLTLGIETSRCRTGCRNLPEGARFNQVTAFLFWGILVTVAVADSESWLWETLPLVEGLP